MKFPLSPLFFAIMLLSASGSFGADAPAPWPDRFVWIFGWNLSRDQDVADITRVLDSAARGGLNGAVLSAGLDALAKRQPDFFRRLDQVQAACQERRLELIPSVFSVGYGGGALAHDKNLAEGFLVKDAPFIAGTGSARFIPDPNIRLDNGDFEQFSGDRLRGFQMQDQPGTVSFADHRVVHDGNASLRLENFRANPFGHGRIMEEVAVRPHRCYRVSAWVRSEGFQPAGAFRIAVLAGARDLAPITFSLRGTTPWKKLEFLFNSLHFEKVRLYAGVWGGESGKIWMDDWTLEDCGPLNVLHRPGTPVRVRDQTAAIDCVEGQDYAPLADPQFNFYWLDRPWPTLKLLPGGRIRPGDQLRVSWRHPMVIGDSQITVCMAEPKLYQVWDEEARLLSEHLHPRRVLLNMDEVRMGGTCQACAGKNMAQLIGECVAKQEAILRRHFPGVEVYVWSDMFDPNHNAHGNYYLVEGDYTGSWNYLPRDVVVAIWGGPPREKSVAFFSGRGFHSLISCYYDADDLANVAGWIRLAQGNPLVRGFMYTPWQKKYDLLAPFGELLRRATR